MTPREIAEHAADRHYLDEPEDDERDAFIAGYLRARADAVASEQARNVTIDSLIDLATIGIRPRR